MTRNQISVIEKTIIAICSIHGFAAVRFDNWRMAILMWSLVVLTSLLQC